MARVSIPSAFFIVFFLAVSPTATRSRALSTRHLQQAEPTLISASANPSSINDKERVTSLPGYGDLGDIQLYSGRLNVSGDAIYYLFAPAQQNNPQNAPLIVFFQGGPGCSGAGTFFNSLGPFKIIPNGNLTLNPISWSTFANVLMIDTPRPTGFSLPTASPKNPSISNDTAATALNLEVIKEFYTKFPEYSSAPLYLAGQSFAGHYLPLLASAIIDENAAVSNTTSTSAATNTTIPLRGIVLGNPWTDPAIDNAAAAEYWRDNGFISNATYTGLLNNCNFSAGALWRTSGPSGMGEVCDTFRNTAYNESGFNDGIIDLYALNEPVCVDGKAPVSIFGYDPCMYNYNPGWLNTRDAQEALHAISKGDSPLEWNWCVKKDVISYPPTDLGTSMLPVWNKLVPALNSTAPKTNLSIVIFSGVQDGYVPTEGTQKWVLGLGRTPTTDEVEVWTDARGQAGGWVLPMEGGLTFVTVKDAGHEVGITTPIRAAQLVKAAVTGDPLTADSLSAASEGLNATAIATTANDTAVTSSPDASATISSSPKPSSDGVQHYYGCAVALVTTLLALL